MLSEGHLVRHREVTTYGPSFSGPSSLLDLLSVHLHVTVHVVQQVYVGVAPQTSLHLKQRKQEQCDGLKKESSETFPVNLHPNYRIYWSNTHMAVHAQDHFADFIFVIKIILSISVSLYEAHKHQRDFISSTNKCIIWLVHWKHKYL